MSPVTTIMTVARAFGWRGLRRRIGYVAGLRTGFIERRTPMKDSYDGVAEVGWEHRFDLDRIRAGYESLPHRGELEHSVVAETDRVLAGQQRLYGWADKDVGWPPRWHVNPFTGHEYPQVHWSEISDNDPAAGDIKDVWELSRLPFTTTFSRAYVLTGDDRYPEAWWRAIEDWAQHNPPNTGVNWRCGQETSLRAIAVCFGLSTFGGHPATTPDRRDLAHRLLGASVARVQLTLGYALSQRNNHAVSELVFLLTLLGPQRRLCRRLLEVLADQFFPDGSYAQQSFTYQRLAVQTLQWLLLTRGDLPPGLRARVIDVVARSRDFLARCSDPVSGWLPNYGANDGALLFSLDDAHYRDFRPFLASLGHHPIDVPSSETEFWLRVDDLPTVTTDAADQPTTYLTLRGPRSLLLCRVGTNGHRAGHADQLAVDVWIDGHNVVTDPGTYRYAAPTPWSNTLTGVEVHSSVWAHGESFAQVGRFLSEPMPDGRVVHRKTDGDVEVMVLERQAGSGTLQRVVVHLEDWYAIIDHPSGTDAHVRWNLHQTSAVIIRVQPEESISVSEPHESDPVSGWTSELYAHRRSRTATLLTIPDANVASLELAPEDAVWPPPNNVAAVLSGVVPEHVIIAALAHLLDSDAT